MTARAQIVFWFVGLIVLGLGVFVLRDILLPFVAGMAVAYFLDPMADRLEKWGLSRTLATTVITALFVVVSAGTMVLFLPLLQQQVLDFIAHLPGYIDALRGLLAPALKRLFESLDPEQMERVKAAFSSVGERAMGWAITLMKNIWQSGLAVFNLVSLLLITPIVTFYLLRDWDRIIERIDGLLPRAHAGTIREQMRLVDSTLAGFVRGQGMVCFVLGVFYALALTLAGLDFGLIVGMAAGIVSFVPYVGAIVGLVISVGLAFLQFDEMLRIAIVAAVFVIGQVLEGTFVTPKFVGDRVGLHPVWVIFGALAGGALFGFVGILLALPVTAVIGVLVRFAIERYVASTLFHGGEDVAAVGHGAPPVADGAAVSPGPAGEGPAEDDGGEPMDDDGGT
jgi:predicted PurR-regulated permease PerM